MEKRSSKELARATIKEIVKHLTTEDTDENEQTKQLVKDIADFYGIKYTLTRKNVNIADSPITKTLDTGNSQKDKKIVEEALQQFGKGLAIANNKWNERLRELITSTAEVNNVLIRLSRNKVSILETTEDINNLTTEEENYRDVFTPTKASNESLYDSLSEKLDNLTKKVEGTLAKRRNSLLGDNKVFTPKKLQDTDKQTTANEKQEVVNQAADTEADKKSPIKTPVKNPPKPARETKGNKFILSKMEQVNRRIIKEIPVFDPLEKSLEINLSRFLNCVTLVHDDLDADKRKIFLILIKNKLVNDAYNLVRNATFDKLDDFKTTLRQAYIQPVALDELYNDLKSIKQRYTESIGAFGTRVEDALNKYTNGFFMKTKAKPEAGHKKLLVEDAKNTFIAGLLDEHLKDKLSCLEELDLAELISKAKNIEIIHKRLGIGSQKEHVREENKKIRFLSESEDKIKDLSNKLDMLLRKTEGRAEKTERCFFCNKPGHYIDQCRVRQNTEYCTNCKKYYHNYRNCPNRNQNDRYQRDQGSWPTRGTQFQGSYPNRFQQSSGNNFNRNYPQNNYQNNGNYRPNVNSQNMRQNYSQAQPVIRQPQAMQFGPAGYQQPNWQRRVMNPTQPEFQHQAPSHRTVEPPQLNNHNPIRNNIGIQAGNQVRFVAQEPILQQGNDYLERSNQEMFSGNIQEPVVVPQTVAQALS